MTGTGRSRSYEHGLFGTQTHSIADITGIRQASGIRPQAALGSPPGDLQRVLFIIVYSDIIL